MADFVLKADRFDHRTGDPLERKTWRFKTYRKGDVLPELDPADEERLLRAGAIETKGESEKARLAELDAERERIEAQITTLEGQKAEVSAGDPSNLKGAELNAALEARGLSTEGKLADKQTRLAEAVAAEQAS